MAVLATDTAAVPLLIVEFTEIVGDIPSAPFAPVAPVSPFAPVAPAGIPSVNRLFDVVYVAVGVAPTFSGVTATDEIGVTSSVVHTTRKTPLVRVKADTLSLPEHESFAESSDTVDPIIPDGIITVNEVPS